MWLGPKLTALSDSLFRTFFRVLFRYDIFISYARRDGRDYAVKLRDQLKQLDFSCFLDYDELPAGNSLNSTLRRALRRSATLVLVGTERAVGSRYVELEVGEFASTGRAIIPIDIEGSLAEAPWAVVRERDIVWIDEARAALERGVPSPNVADQIDKLFKYTRRNSRVRAQVLATLGLFVVVVAASLFLIRQQVNAATTAAAEADRQRGAAVAQKRAADEASALAEKRRLEAEAATEAARRAQRDAEEALKRVAAAEKAAGAATAEAKRQERAALSNAVRARAAQRSAEAERARAEEGTRYVQSQSAGVHAALALEGGGELEQAALLTVESLKKSLTPEGYSAWGRAAGLLPRVLPPDPALKAEGEVTAVAYEPVGRWLAVGGRGGATLRPQLGGEPVRLRLRRTEGEVTKISFARGGELVALACENYFELWDVRGPARLMSLDGYTSGSVALSPDGLYVAAVGPQHEPVMRVYKTSAPSTPSSEKKLEGVRYGMGVAFSADGRWLAVALVPSKVVLWQASSVEKLAESGSFEFGLSSNEIPHHIAFGPRGSLGIITALGGGVALTEWSLSLTDDGAFSHQAGSRVSLPSGGDLLRWSVAYSPDESLVAVAAKDQTARVWETDGGREVARRAYDKEVSSVAFSADGRTLTAVSGGVADSWKTEFGPAAARLEHAADVKGVAVSPGGEWLVTAGEGGARVFRTSDWSEFRNLGTAGSDAAPAFSPDGRWLAVKSGRRVVKRRGFYSDVKDADEAVVFDTRTWEVVKTFGLLNEDAGFGFSPGGRWLVLKDGRFVKLLEPGTWREARSLEHSDPVKEVYFSPEGLRISVKVAGQYRRGIQRIFDRRERAYVWDAGGGLAACGTVYDNYTPNAAESEHQATAAGSVPCPGVDGHAQKDLLAAAFTWEKVLPGGNRPSSPDGRWLVQFQDGNFDTVLALREGNAKRAVATLVRGGGASGWDFTPDSRWLVVTDGPFVKVWPLKPADLIAVTCARLRRRDLSAEEWRTYFSGEKSEPTCVP
ncbi:MAG TPA: TIR domain-containing protein [Pyrinomonadaceae bacterium]|nr:TIR domain-containing protein [Pyrinomonadaceae bacterium]